ncbi:MAG: DUF6438 domain-containing protein, partial [Candidatus Eremiobacteraeota bacterium]|nr:DUF6438 domain-containing protein [Candidatus Eremiobacteraeota bacterium]
MSGQATYRGGSFAPRVGLFHAHISKREFAEVARLLQTQKYWELPEENAAGNDGDASTLTV